MEIWFISLLIIHLIEGKARCSNVQLQRKLSWVSSSSNLRPQEMSRASSKSKVRPQEDIKGCIIWPQEAVNGFLLWELNWKWSLWSICHHYVDDLFEKCRKESIANLYEKPIKISIKMKIKNFGHWPLLDVCFVL